MNTTFSELGLNPQILESITDMGYSSPTDIQAAAIPHILSTDQDLIALAQTGTGKTAAFSLPLLHRIDPTQHTTQAIILSPTRELCLQIAENVHAYALNMPKVSVAAVYGGADIGRQIKQVERAQIVVGTPGRTLDLIKRKKLHLDSIRWVVLDEADEMLSMGFSEDMNEILSHTPDTKQTLLFSATMPNEIARITQEYMHDPFEISIGHKNVSAANVAHIYLMAKSRDRYSVLKRIVDIHPQIYGIIFCRTRQETKDIADQLMQEGYNADALHGDLSQAQRSYVMNRFKNRQLQLLVATDVAARGVDVDDLTHVLHYNLPDDPEVYIHRSGRTGRAGKSGVSIIIIHSRETHKIKQLTNIIKKPIERMLVPTGREVCEAQLLNLIDEVKTVEVNEEEIAGFLPTIYDKLADLDREALIKQFVSLQFNQFLKYYQDAVDINVSQNAPSERRSSGRFTRFKIDRGRKQHIQPRNIIQMVNRSNPNSSIKIGSIDIFNNFTFFDADSAHQDDLLTHLNGMDWDGEALSVVLAKPGSGTDKRAAYDSKPYKRKGKPHRKGGGPSSKPKRPKRK